jgi:hypothetical protein
MDQKTFLLLYVLGVFAVLLLRELFKWVKEEIDEDMHLAGKLDSRKDAR